MKIKGKMHQITDVYSYVSHFIQQANQPNPNTRPYSDIRVHLAIAFKPGFPSRFFPNSSLIANTDVNGNFEFDLESFPYYDFVVSANLKMYIIAYRVAYRNPFTGVPIYAPIYRSEKFPLNRVTEEVKDIYVACITTPNEKGVTQTRLTNEMNLIKGRVPDLDSLIARIRSSYIYIEGKGRGATITCDLRLRPDTSSNLNLFLKTIIDDFDIDLPGPDWLVGLFVNEGKIEREIKDTIGKMTVQLNEDIISSVINEVVNRYGVAENLIRDVLNTVTVTFNKVRHPVVEIVRVGPFRFRKRAIVPDPCIGFPRKIY